MSKLSDKVENYFVKTCTNAVRAYEYVTTDGKLQKVPMRFRRGDLSQWAEEAFARGDNYFYTEPVDPKEPYGKLRLTEPEYVYKLQKNLTPEQYEELVTALKSVE